jgi:hypothetical protein
VNRTRAPRLVGIAGIAGGVMVLLGFPVGKVEPATPSVKAPGPYPYETPVQVPVPDIVESTIMPTPAPFPYRESAPSLIAGQDREVRTADTQRPLTAKAVREAAFEYNGVPNFCGFLAALPANVSVFDPKLGRTRILVKGDRVVRKNVTWFHKRKQAHSKSNDRTIVSVEELGRQNPGI